MTAPTIRPIEEEPEHVPVRPIAWTFGATILAIVASVVVVWTLRAFDLYGGGRSDVKDLHLVLHSGPFVRQPAAPGLDEWQWADRSHERVVLPVDVAIDRYLEARR